MNRCSYFKQEGSVKPKTIDDMVAALMDGGQLKEIVCKEKVSEISIPNLKLIKYNCGERRPENQDMLCNKYLILNCEQGISKAYDLLEEQAKELMQLGKAIKGELRDGEYSWQ